MKSVIQSDKSLTFGEETKQLGMTMRFPWQPEKDKASQRSLWLVTKQNEEEKRKELKNERGFKNGTGRDVLIGLTEDELICMMNEEFNSLLFQF